MSHDFKQDGSRTAWRRKLGPLYLWVEESAAFHAYGATHYGATLDRWDHDSDELQVHVGRWTLHATLV